MLRLDGSYPVTPLNLLQVNMGVGYDTYLEHPKYSALRLESGSQISWNTYVRDFEINVHNGFQYVQDPAEEASVAATGRYGGLDNTVGVAATWNKNDLALTLGYDHRNFVSSDASFDDLDLASELILARAAIRTLPSLIMGVEAGGSFTTYDQNYFNNNDGYCAGLFANWQPGSYFRLQAEGGDTAYFYQQTSRSLQASDHDDLYGRLTATHDITDATSYSLAAGHELRLGSSADFVSDWYVRPAMTWKYRNLRITPHVSFETGRQGRPNAHDDFHEYYNWCEAEADISQLVTKNLMVTLKYRQTFRASTVESRGYDQNFVGVCLVYQFE